MMKKLLIDVNPVVPYFVSGTVNGIGRTTRELLMALAEEENIPFEIILYSQNMKGIGGRNLQLPFRCKHLYFPHRENYDKLLAKFPVKEWFTGYDLMHITHNFEYVRHPERCIVTLHDALFFVYHESFLGHDFARINYPKLAQKCKAIVTCSESSKRDIVKYMNVPEEKVNVIHWGVSTQLFYPETKVNILRVNQKYQLYHPYFIMVSCDIGRKNTELLMENFRNYVREGGKYDLILIWKNPSTELLRKYSKEIENKSIRLLSGISEDELRALYSGAIASFFPSKYEGFGLPVLESMACGTPVITCRNSSLEEVGGDAAFYVLADSKQEMANYMHDFEGGKRDFFYLKNKALQHVENFTWKKAAKKYIEFYTKYLQ